MNMLTLSKNHFSSIFHISRLAKKKDKGEVCSNSSFLNGTLLDHNLCISKSAMKEAAVPNTPSRKTSLW